MPKSAKHWLPGGSNTQMHPGMFNGQTQDLYLEDSCFKGMAQILLEHDFTDTPWLPAQCKGFKCIDTSPTAQCCCCCILFNQPDFQNQQAELTEFIKA